MWYKKLELFLEQGINFRANSFFKTGSKFGVLGGTYPPKKYPSASPPPNNVELDSMHEAKVNITKGISLRKHQQFQTLEVIFSKKR